MAARRPVSVLITQHDAGEAAALAELLREDGLQVIVEPLQQPEQQRSATDLATYAVVTVGAASGIADRERFCRELRSRGYAGAILALAANVIEVPALLDAGADDFLVAPIKASELLVRVRMALRRGATRVRVRWGEIEIDRVERTVTLRGRPLVLTAREYALLVCLVDAAGAPVSRADLLARVWGIDEDPGSNVVEVHLSRLRDKFGEDAPLFETVRKTGYRLRRP